MAIIVRNSHSEVYRAYMVGLILPRLQHHTLPQTDDLKNPVALLINHDMCRGTQFGTEGDRVPGFLTVHLNRALRILVIVIAIRCGGLGTTVTGCAGSALGKFLLSPAVGDKSSWKVEVP